MELKLGSNLNCQVETSIELNEAVRNLEIVNKVTEILGMDKILGGQYGVSRMQPETDPG